MLPDPNGGGLGFAGVRHFLNSIRRAAFGEDFTGIDIYHTPVVIPHPFSGVPDLVRHQPDPIQHLVVGMMGVTVQGQAATGGRTRCSRSVATRSSTEKMHSTPHWWNGALGGDASIRWLAAPPRVRPRGCR